MSNIVKYSTSVDSKVEFSGENFILDVLEKLVYSGEISNEEREEAISKIFSIAMTIINNFEKEEETFFSSDDKENLLKNMLFELGYHFKDQSPHSIYMGLCDNTFFARFAVANGEIKKEINEATKVMKSIVSFANEYKIYEFAYYANVISNVLPRLYKIASKTAFDTYSDIEGIILEERMKYTHARGCDSSRAELYRPLIGEGTKSSFEEFIKLVYSLKHEVEFLKKFPSEVASELFYGFIVEIEDDIAGTLKEYCNNVAEVILLQSVFCNYIGNGNSLKCSIEEFKNIIFDIVYGRLDASELFEEYEKSEIFLSLSEGTKSYLEKYKKFLQERIDRFKRGKSKNNLMMIRWNF